MFVTGALGELEQVVEALDLGAQLIDLGQQLRPRRLRRCAHEPMIALIVPTAPGPDFGAFCEAGDYAGASFARLVEITEALDVTVHDDVRLTAAG